MTDGTLMLAQAGAESLTSSEQTLWWVALAVGAVVLMVVVALLSLLLRVVGDVDDNVEEVWEAAKRVAVNTAAVYQLPQTGRYLEALRSEAATHDALLEDLL